MTDLTDALEWWDAPGPHEAGPAAVAHIDVLATAARRVAEASDDLSDGEARRIILGVVEANRPTNRHDDWLLAVAIWEALNDPPTTRKYVIVCGNCGKSFVASKTPEGVFYCSDFCFVEGLAE